jgi:uncharacterized protein (DUF1800 family)
MISGSPTQAGTWHVPITATNANGSGSALLTIQVIATGSAINREVWTGVPGTAISDIPLETAPTAKETLNVFEAPLDAADDYGARIRGYITAPLTGIYKFWLTASNSAELYISDDDDPVNSGKRAQVVMPTGHRAWTNVNAGRSPLLWLEAGRRYYVEVRHKAGVGSDHLSVGWLKPGEGLPDPANAAAPSEVVPAYALSPYVEPAAMAGESALYTATLTSQGNAQTGGSGSASIQLSADGAQAILRFGYSNLTATVTGKHVHSDAFDNHTAGEIIFDIDDFAPQPDGSYVWNIVPTGTFSSTEQIVDAITRGAAYLNVHTASYPSGEIKGNFRLQAASRTFTPPPLQTWGDPESAGSNESHLNRNGAARFLIQASFGPDPASIASVQALGFEGWIDEQLDAPISYHFPFVYANRNQTSPGASVYTGALAFNAWWRNSVTASDQLRQRVAFALSEIMVVSENGPLFRRGDALSDYYDMLLDGSFGNFRTLLENVTLHPAMGRYLDMLRNKKPDKATGRIPNENYAREIEQLFSIGLNRMHPDGSLVLNSKGEAIPTYDQNAIIGFGHVFTGWDYHYTGAYQTSQTSFGAAENWVDPMREVPTLHFTGPKRLLNNVVLPGLATVGGEPLDPDAVHTSSQYNDPAYQALPAQELAAAHDALFHHPNCGPFICRQLIQRLVTGTPSRGYLHRVVQAFNGERNVHGLATGARGDMRDVIKAILLDYEARSSTLLNYQGYGKQREPLLRIAAIARAFPSPSLTGTYVQTGSLVTVSTSSNHLYSNGNSVFLDFDESTAGDSGSPTDALYQITVLNPTQFTVRTKSFEAATYQQGGAITRLTTTGDGFYSDAGTAVYVEYLTGAPAPPASGPDVIDFRSSDESQIIFGTPTSKKGTYAQSGTTITFTSNAHGFAVGNSLRIDFVSGGAPSGVYTVVTATTNTFTVTVAGSATRSGTAFAIVAANALPTISGSANVTRQGEFANRSGPIVTDYSDWNMDTTDADLNQTPLNAPTVFNFFLPDYQYPGALSQAGLITPEFQLTSETSVMRQVNFINGGLYSDSLGQNGLGSFKSGQRDMMVDLRPWMDAGPGGLPWVHNVNLLAFIDELNTRLMAGQLPTAARTIIRNHLLTFPYSATPTTTELRDRARAVVQLIITSPHFAIQK